MLNRQMFYMDFCILQVSPTCREVEVVNYEVELIATHSDARLLFISSGDVRNHTVTLRSPDIKMNELYECYVRIERVSKSQSMRMNLSRLCYYYAIRSLYELFTLFKAHLMTLMTSIWILQSINSHQTM